MVKRIFAALLTLAMLLSVCSVEVFADDTVLLDLQTSYGANDDFEKTISDGISVVDSNGLFYHFATSYKNSYWTGKVVDALWTDGCKVVVTYTGTATVGIGISGNESTNYAYGKIQSSVAGTDGDKKTATFNAADLIENYTGKDDTCTKENFVI